MNCSDFNETKCEARCLLRKKKSLHTVQSVLQSGCLWVSVCMHVHHLLLPNGRKNIQQGAIKTPSVAEEPVFYFCYHFEVLGVMSARRQAKTTYILQPERQLWQGDHEGPTLLSSGCDSVVIWKLRKAFLLPRYGGDGAASRN